MESVLAGGTSLVWRLHVGGDDRVTDGTLALALQSTLDVAPESHQPIDQAAVSEHNHSLDRDHPVFPLLLVD